MNMMIEVTPTGHALPGRWYGDYCQDWRKAFSDISEHPGCYLGDIWHTYTPSWDKWWFENLAVKMPQHTVTLPAALGKVSQ